MLAPLFVSFVLFVVKCLTVTPGECPWISARAGFPGQDDRLLQVAPVLSMIDDGQAYLAMDVE